ncbi:hypothetical protein BRC86_05750 [Halobacteriales archaeon QS_3_64_16]|nr:MAG: hypothetical protein BRC86_05750 [Halobacteriales archaeon QS_3_64_16]
MSTVAEFRVPVEEFALERTLGKIPDAEFDIERAVPVSADRVMVVLWAHGPDYDDLRAALEADPAVTDLQGLVDLDIDGSIRCTGRTTRTPSGPHRSRRDADARLRRS